MARKSAAKAKAPRKSAKKSEAKPSDLQPGKTDNTAEHPAGSESHGVSAAAAKASAPKKSAKAKALTGPGAALADRVATLEKQALLHGWHLGPGGNPSDE